MRLFLQLVQKNVLQLYQTIGHTRCFVTRSTKLKEIGKTLGLPEKPKRAATPYNRFFKETYPTIQDVEKKKRADVAREIAALWKRCDASKQQKYKEAFEKDQAEYQKKIADYKRQVTDAQLSMLKLDEKILKEEETLKHERRNRDAQWSSLGKPKRPLPQFAIFSQDLRQKSTQKLSLTEIAVIWRELSDVERKSYTERASENSKRYKQEMQKWKDKAN